MGNTVQLQERNRYYIVVEHYDYNHEIKKTERYVTPYIQSVTSTLKPKRMQYIYVDIYTVKTKIFDIACGVDGKYKLHSENMDNIEKKRIGKKIIHSLPDVVKLRKIFDLTHYEVINNDETEEGELIIEVDGKRYTKKLNVEETEFANNNGIHYYRRAVVLMPNAFRKS